MPEDLKVIALGSFGRLLWENAIFWSNNTCADGFIPDAKVPQLAAHDDPDWRASFARVLAQEMWTRATLRGLDGYRIVNYHKYQPHAALVKLRAVMNRARQQLFRHPELKKFVRTRDANRCRYCCIEVRWRDRRGDAGGTYDLLDPSQPASAENLVVTCRACRRERGFRPLDASGLTLQPPPPTFPQERRADQLTESRRKSGSTFRPPSPPPRATQATADRADTPLSDRNQIFGDTRSRSRSPDPDPRAPAPSAGPSMPEKTTRQVKARPPDAAKFSVYAAMGHAVVEAFGARADYADLSDEMKTRCARARIIQDPDMIRRAIDAAIAAATKRRTG